MRTKHLTPALSMNLKNIMDVDGSLPPHPSPLPRWGRNGCRVLANMGAAGLRAVSRSERKRELHEPARNIQHSTFNAERPKNVERSPWALGVECRMLNAFQRFKGSMRELFKGILILIPERRSPDPAR